MPNEEMYLICEWIHNNAKRRCPTPLYISEDNCVNFGNKKVKIYICTSTNNPVNKYVTFRWFKHNRIDLDSFAHYFRIPTCFKNDIEIEWCSGNIEPGVKNHNGPEKKDSHLSRKILIKNANWFNELLYEHSNS